MTVSAWPPKSGVSALSAECSDYTKDYPMQKSYSKTPDPYSESSDGR